MLTTPLSLSTLDFIAVLLVGILIVLIVIFVALWRRNHMMARPLAVDSVSLASALEQIKEASAHAASVSAVLSLMDQLEDNPDALELIKSYPETVRAAAWLHYINILGADLQAAQVQLSHAHRGTGPYQHYSPTSLQQFRMDCQDQVNIIRGKLDAAIKASGQTGLRPVS